MPLIQTDTVEIRRITGKGRGVFARRAIANGEVIERVPVVVMPANENDGEAVLSNYYFAWGKDTIALALGYGSLYNHSFKPNARYDDIGQQTKVFTAIRDIKAGEEITVNYNGDPASKTPVSFKVLEPARVVTPAKPSTNGKA